MKDAPELDPRLLRGYDLPGEPSHEAVDRVPPRRFVEGRLRIEAVA
jgi:hypothetical protein